MKKKKKQLVCHECELEFELVFKTKKVPQICPFCGDSIDCVDALPLLKDFDQYDDFEDDKYFDDDFEDYDEDE